MTRQGAIRVIDLDDSDSSEHGVMIDRWAPESIQLRSARPVALHAIPSSVVYALITFLGVLVVFTTTPKSEALLSGVIGGLVVGVAAFLGQVIGGWKTRPHVPVADTSFTLTPTSVCIRCGTLSRTLLLSRVERVVVLPLRGHRGIGHVVFVERGKPHEPPSIPFWVNVDPRTPGIQELRVNPGALTFWLLANPESVRDRVLGVTGGVNQNARGPYR